MREGDVGCLGDCGLLARRVRAGGTGLGKGEVRMGLGTGKDEVRVCRNKWLLGCAKEGGNAAIAADCADFEARVPRGAYTRSLGPKVRRCCPHRL